MGAAHELVFVSDLGSQAFEYYHKRYVYGFASPCMKLSVHVPEIGSNIWIPLPQSSVGPLVLLRLD